MTLQFSYTSHGYGINDCAYHYSATPVYGATSTGTVTLTGGDIIDTLRASINNGNGALLSATRTWKVGTFHVAVTPHGGTATPPPNTTGVTQPFSITNHGNSNATFTLQVVTCSGGIPNCSPTTTWENIDPGATKTVNFSYNTGAADTTGTIEVKASYDQYSDVGTVHARVTATAVANTRVLVREVNPGTSIDRASCVAFSIGRDLASECGVPRVRQNALPTVRTLNKMRSPTLIYYS